MNIRSIPESQDSGTIWMPSPNGFGPDLSREPVHNSQQEGLSQMAMIEERETAELLKKLISINSVNPTLTPGGSGERAIAEFVHGFFRELGIPSRIQEIGPGRANVIAWIKGRRPGAPKLMLNGHLDTVGGEGMTVPPFEGVEKDGKIFGRGAADMKGGVAAAMMAMKALALGEGPEGDVIFTGVADEEYASIGTEAIVREYHADAAIVCEPTGGEIHIAHKGFIWATLETFGKAAHGSRPAEGIDAIFKMGRVIAGVEKLHRDLQAKRHPVTGAPSVHASLIAGGRELSTYPDYCRLQVERRTIPGEGPGEFEAELREMLGAMAAGDPEFKYNLELFFIRSAYEIEVDHPLVRTLRSAAVNTVGRNLPTAGASYWADTAVLGAAGIPGVLFGPGGEGIHGAEEYVYLDQVMDCARIITRAALDFTAGS